MELFSDVQLKKVKENNLDNCFSYHIFCSNIPKKNLNLVNYIDQSVHFRFRTFHFNLGLNSHYHLKSLIISVSSLLIRPEFPRKFCGNRTSATQSFHFIYLILT